MAAQHRDQEPLGRGFRTPLLTADPGETDWVGPPGGAPDREPNPASPDAALIARCVDWLLIPSDSATVEARVQRGAEILRQTLGADHVEVHLGSASPAAHDGPPRPPSSHAPRANETGPVARDRIRLMLAGEGQSGDRVEVVRSGAPFDEGDRSVAERFGVAFRAILRGRDPGRDAADPTTQLRHRLEQLGIALQAGTDLDETLQAVADLATEIVGGRSAAIRLLEPGDRFVVRAIAGDTAVQQLRQVVFSISEGVVGEVARTLRPALRNEFDSAVHPYGDEVRAARIFSLICVPILSTSGGHAIGTLTVHNKRRGEPFLEHDQAALVAFAAHAAVAVERAILREQQQEAAREANTLHEVASAITSLKLTWVLSVAARKVREVSGVPRCAILLYNPMRRVLRVGETDGYDPPAHAAMRPVRIAFPATDPLHQRLLGGVPVDLPDPNAASTAQDEVCRLLEANNPVVVPMLNHGDLVGALVLDAAHDGSRLSDRQCRILLSVASQIASAIENARLYEEAEGRVAELSALQRISFAISSQIQLKEMLESVLTEIVEVMGADAGSIMLYFEERATLRVEASIGLDALPTRRREQSIEEGVAGWVATRREALLTDHIAAGTQFRLVAPRREIASAIVVPLISNQRLQGVLSVSTGSPERRYTERDRNFMQTLASAVALGIENARHYERERQIAQIARAALLPRIRLSVPGLDIGEKHVPAYEVGGDYYHVFDLGDEKVGILVSDVSGKGVSAAMHAAMGKNFIRALSHSSRCPSEVLDHANALVARDTPTEIFISVFYGVFDVGTGHLAYSNAGHVSPFVAHADRTLEELTSTGMVLGLWDDSRYATQETVLSPGEVLLCYTDGVTEAKRGSELFGEERLKSALTKHWQRPAQEIVDLIYKRTVAFAGRNTGDDLALLAVKRL